MQAGWSPLCPGCETLQLCHREISPGKQQQHHRDTQGKVRQHKHLKHVPKKSSLRHNISHSNCVNIEFAVEDDWGGFLGGEGKVYTFSFVWINSTYFWLARQSLCVKQLRLVRDFLKEFSTLRCSLETAGFLHLFPKSRIQCHTSGKLFFSPSLFACLNPYTSFKILPCLTLHLQHFKSLRGHN